MMRSRKVGILSLNNSPLLDLLGIYHATIGLPSNVEFHLIKANKNVSKSGIDRFMYRTQGIFQEKRRAKIPFKSVNIVSSHIDNDCLSLISDLGLDLGINLGTHAVLTSGLFSSFAGGVLNCHPGELPKYRGSCSPEWTLFNDDRLCSTLHYMDSAIDSGPIINKVIYRTDIPFTYFELRALVLWGSLAQTLDWVSTIKLSSSDLHNDFPKGLSQGEGVFWSPINDEQLARVIDKRKRISGGELDLLNRVNMEDWVAQFAYTSSG